MGQVTKIYCTTDSCILCQYYLWYQINIFNILRELLLGDSKIIRLILRSYLRHSKTRETWIPLKYLFNWIFNPLILSRQRRYDKEENRAHSWMNRLNRSRIIFILQCYELLLPLYGSEQNRNSSSCPLDIFEYLNIQLDQTQSTNSFPLLIIIQDTVNNKQTNKHYIATLSSIQDMSYRQCLYFYNF